MAIIQEVLLIPRVEVCLTTTPAQKSQIAHSVATVHHLTAAGCVIMDTLEHVVPSLQIVRLLETVQMTAAGCIIINPVPS